MENIEILIGKIQGLKYEMEHFEVDPDDYIDEYNQMLDDCYEDFMGMYSTGYTLNCVDETAWRCGLLDYVDNLEVSYPSEWDDDLEELVDELRDLIDVEIEWHKETLEDLQQDLENGNDVGVDMDEHLLKIKYLEDLQNEWF